MKPLTERIPQFSLPEPDTSNFLPFENDPLLVEQCRVGVRILKYRNQNTAISEEMRRILAKQKFPQRRFSDNAPFSQKGKKNV